MALQTQYPFFELNDKSLEIFMRTAQLNYKHNQQNRTDTFDVDPMTT